MFGCVITIFCVCWLPYHAYFIYSYYDPAIMAKWYPLLFMITKHFINVFHMKSLDFFLGFVHMIYLVFVPGTPQTCTWPSIGWQWPTAASTPSSTIGWTKGGFIIFSCCVAKLNIFWKCKWSKLCKALPYHLSVDWQSFHKVKNQKLKTCVVNWDKLE